VVVPPAFVGGFDALQAICERVDLVVHETEQLHSHAFAERLAEPLRSKWLRQWQKWNDELQAHAPTLSDTANATIRGLHAVQAALKDTPLVLAIVPTTPATFIAPDEHARSTLISMGHGNVLTLHALAQRLNAQELSERHPLGNGVGVEPRERSRRKLYNIDEDEIPF
jgi:hypothetical protein